MWRHLLFLAAPLLSAPLLAGSAYAVDRAVCPTLGSACSGLPIACTDTSLDAAITASGGGGANVYVMPGNYGSTHDIDASVDVIGVTCPAQGLLTRPRFNQTSNDTIDVTGASTVATVTFLHIDGGARCVRVRDGSQVTFTDVIIENCDRAVDGIGILIEANGDVDLIDSTIRNNDSSGTNIEGAGIHMAGSTLDIVGSTFDNNTAEEEGGAIYIVAGVTTVTDAVFLNNDATSSSVGDGGAIAVLGGTSLTVTDSTFTDNFANSQGGSIFVNAATTVLIDGGVFRGVSLLNHADQGGAIDVVTSSDFDVLGTTFQDLFTSNRGGAIYVAGGPLYVDGATFDTNHVTAGEGDGGAIQEATSGVVDIRNSFFYDHDITDDGVVRMSGGSQTLSNNWFEGNLCDDGCGLYIESTTTDTGSVYVDNIAADDGAAVIIRNGPVTFNGVTFDGNVAMAGTGGAIDSDNGDLVTLIDCIATSNSAAVAGGHVYINASSDPTSTLVVTGGSYTGGSATWGGAIHTDLDVIVDIADAEFTDNRATENGGAIDHYPQNDTRSIDVFNCMFSGNFADFDNNGSGAGGAMLVSSAGLVTLTDNRFWGNDADDGGAVYFLSSANNYDLVRNDFCGNTAGGNGGAVWMDGIEGATTRVFENNVLRGNGATGAGGALYASSTQLGALNNTFVGNTSTADDGAIYANSVTGTFRNNLISHSPDGGVWGSSFTASRNYNAYFNNAGGDVSTDGGSTWLAYAANDLSGQDPDYVSYSPGDGDCSNDRLWYFTGSPMIDAGDPAICDVGGVTCATAPDRSDIGAYGGQNMDAQLFADADGDTYRPIDGDCDDTNANVNPGEVDIPADGVDSNCDGLELCIEDDDLDGFGTVLGTTVSTPFTDCIGPGVAVDTTDCDDTDSAVYVGAIELVADGVDQDCNGAEVCYADGDGDGFGHVSNVTPGALTCTGAGIAATNDDCNDGAAGVNPGAVEVVADGIDQNCDTDELCYVDSDGDTYGSATPGLTVVSPDLSCNQGNEANDNQDCNDAAASINPGAVEVVADGIDQNCNTDELCYRDDDNDDYGESDTINSDDLDCTDPLEAPVNTDCLDTDPAVRPGATELPADGVDQNCDTDELCYADVDQDGFGNEAGTTVVSGDLDCTDLGEAVTTTDCNDNAFAVKPSAVELAADGVDQNCDDQELCYLDADSDGYGGTSTRLSNSLTCANPGERNTNTDCNDGVASINPGATEIVGDGVDQTCDGLERCYDDVDNDGFAGGIATVTSPDLTCSTGDLSPVIEDCNDNRADIKPGATEIAGDLVDQNCDTRELCFNDNDNDGYGSTSTSLSPLGVVNCVVANDHSTVNTDCDDNNPAAWPGAGEVTANGVDEDCNGRETCHTDADNDNFGIATLAQSNPGDLVCAGNFVANVPGDCNDGDATVYPGATETVANDKDQDCDGFELCWLDVDLDGYGDTNPISSASITCSVAGVSDRSDDCDDGNPGAFPGAPEVPEDGIDQDCDGVDLEGCFQDLDLDGYGSSIVIYAPGDPNCAQSGRSLNQADCNDGNAAINPGVVSDPCDGVDANCDGQGGPATDEDLDLLTWTQEVALGTDGCDPDTDGDTITDGLEELQIGSDPLSTDSDGDGAPDQSEIGPNPLNPADLDNDGTADILDLDDDGDGVDTADEDYAGLGPVNQDTDNDTVPDYLDVDDDGDGVETRDEDDEFPNGDPTDDDCDNDGVPNYLSPDDDGDGVPTALELLLGSGRCNTDSDGDFVDDGTEWLQGDTNNDGEPDIIDGDDDGDGIPTFDEFLWFIQDVDGDYIPNWLDTNSDGDARDDIVEGTNDDDNDGTPNYVDADDTDGGASDSDGDGWATIDEINVLGSNQFSPDSDGDGVDDRTEVVDIDAPLDSDGDLEHDVLDTDDDGDGLDTRFENPSDATECPDGSDVLVTFAVSGSDLYMVYRCAGDNSEFARRLFDDADPRAYLDSDLDGTPDYLDDDDDGDGVPTFLEDRDGDGDWTDEDLDADGIPDWLDGFDADGPAGDLDGDGQSNGDEEADGTDPLNADSDGDGVPDGEEGTGDLDADGIIDALDPDDDGDGIPSAVEGEGDVDGDGVPNRLDDDSDGDGKSDAVEGVGDSDCDGVPEWADADETDASCDSVDGGKGEIVVWEGCDGCSATGGAGAGWLGLGLVALVARRRRVA